MFKEGDRVILITTSFNNSPSNPAWGLEYSCVGTIIKVDATHLFPVFVRWDNGLRNHYADRHLELYKEVNFPMENNPNITFKKAIRKKAFDNF